MAAATILHVGDDICHRIPIMERNGLFVVRSECSIAGVRRSFATGDIFCAVTFHNDLFPVRRELVLAARDLSRAPLIFFENTLVDHDDELFNLVIRVPTPPEVWSRTLKEVIRQSRQIHEQSLRLRQECLTLCDESQNIRESLRLDCLGRLEYKGLFGVEFPKPDGSDGGAKGS